jgi:hypothetical protein
MKLATLALVETLTETVDASVIPKSWSEAQTGPLTQRISFRAFITILNKKTKVLESIHG